MSSSVLRDDVERQLRSIIEDASKSDDPAAKQVADFLASWMDEKRIEARAVAPLKPYLDKVTAVRTRDDLLRLFTEPAYTSPIDIGPNPMEPTRYFAMVWQGGLGMPNRGYYLLEGDTYDRYRKAYREYIVRVQTLAGILRELRASLQRPHRGRTELADEIGEGGLPAGV